MKKKLINNFFVFLVVLCQISLVTVHALDEAMSPQELKKTQVEFNEIHQSLSDSEKEKIAKSLSKGDCLLLKKDWDNGKKTFSKECILEKMKHTVNSRQ